MADLTLTPDYLIVNQESSGCVDPCPDNILGCNTHISFRRDNAKSASAPGSPTPKSVGEAFAALGVSANKQVPHLIDYTRFTQSLNNLRNAIKKEKPSTSVVRKVLLMNWRDVGK